MWDESEDLVLEDFLLQQLKADGRDIGVSDGYPYECQICKSEKLIINKLMSKCSVF